MKICKSDQNISEVFLSLKSSPSKSQRCNTDREKVKMVKFKCLPVADLRGGEGRALPSPKFLHCHAVFEKNWPNNRSAPPFGVSVPSSGKS